MRVVQSTAYLPRTKLVDFGVASSSDVRLTRTGAVVGTPAYMAPEQARGDGSADARSDIYSLGATLFELIAGRPPHMGPNSIATLARLVTTPAPRLSELLLDVPRELDALIHSMLSSNPDERPSSAREVAAAIDELLLEANLPGLARAAEPRVELTSSGTRLVTTLVALHVARGDERQWELERLREHGADALPLGDDSLVAHLGVQRAYGDEGSRALELGLTLAARGARVGVATGRMRVDRVRSAGEVVDHAAALAREAGPGGLLADANTADLARGRFQFKMLPRGIAMVVGLGLRRDPGTMAPFVGRDAEFISTLSAYDRCVEDSTPVVVTVSGPPGIGKSRLGREFIARLLSPPAPLAPPEAADGSTPIRAPRLMHMRCESYGRGQALGVATDALRSLLGLPKGASLEQAEAAIAERKLVRQDGGLLARLLANQPFPEGIDPRGARDALWLSMTELVLGACATEPCALLVEDAQWSDPESIAWIDHLLGRAGNKPLFVMMLMRPAFWRSQGQRFVGRDHVRVELRPIARRATREIARSMIGAAATDAVLDQVAQQAAGSPLFAEELARVVASGRDMGTAPTIEAAIQVSLDGLEEAARDAVVWASVFGMSVWDAGVVGLGVDDAASSLRKLVGAELLVEHPGSRFAGTREYLFKHALVRDVAYASVGEDLKKQLHAAAARWLASMGEDSATVAQHFDLGGRHEEAADHWEAAARRALATNSLREAVTMADRALTFAIDKPVAFARAVLLDEAYSRLDARASERDSAIRAMSDNQTDEASELKTLGARARYDDACASGSDIEERLTRVRERARALDLVDEEARCSATLAHRYAFGGGLAQAEREAEHLLDLAERRQIVWAAVDAWQALAVVHQTRGEVAAALQARRSAARAARAAGLQEREAILTMNVGFALTTIGAWEEALHELSGGPRQGARDRQRRRRAARADAAALLGRHLRRRRSPRRPARRAARQRRRGRQRDLGGARPDHAGGALLPRLRAAPRRRRRAPQGARAAQDRGRGLPLHREPRRAPRGARLLGRGRAPLRARRASGRDRRRGRAARGGRRPQPAQRGAHLPVPPRRLRRRRRPARRARRHGARHRAADAAAQGPRGHALRTQLPPRAAAQLGAARGCRGLRVYPAGDRPAAPADRGLRRQQRAPPASCGGAPCGTGLSWGEAPPRGRGDGGGAPMLATLLRW